MACGSPSGILVLASRGNSRWDCVGEPVPQHRSRRVLCGQTSIILAAAIITGLVGCNSANTAHMANLSWDPSPSAVVGYNVYRGTQSGGPYTKLNSSPVAVTRYTDSTVQPGQTYFYIVKAVNSKNVQSVPSGEVSAAVPANTFLGSLGVVGKWGLKKLQRGYDDAR
ncbi:MAG: hypothetical protein DMG31_16265 [Acidobacteria bacterium]|nr:MAG: hypothetical protein DMG31_16265 [Acidobacteriota bacterium]